MDGEEGDLGEEDFQEGMEFFLRPIPHRNSAFLMHFLTNLLKTEDDDQGDDEDVGEDEDDDDEGKDGPTLADLYNAQEAGLLPLTLLFSYLLYFVYAF